MAKLIKSHDAARVGYLKQVPAPVYPLWGYAFVDGKRVTLEDLRGSWSSPDPTWELCTPEGYVFKGDGLHNMLFYSLKEVRDYLITAELEECEKPCSWCGAI
jgi:hypothetical protein